MSRIASLRVQNVRTHAAYDLQLSPSVTLISGPNGSGKTSLIEALYIALQGSSFKGSDADILAYGAPWYRIDVAFDDESTRTVKFDPLRPTGRKQFVIDGKTHYRLTFPHRYPIVLFEPEDLRLLNGSPTRRRQFIDQFISQLDPQYALSVRRYDRALKQRNALLKQPQINPDELFAWNVSLSEYGAYIMQQRSRFIDELNSRLNDVYESIAHTSDTVTMRYSVQYSATTQQKLLSELHEHTQRDRLLGYTSTGPHRHDVLFEFNGNAALSVASRGEVRSIVLALKFLEVDIIKSITQKSPIVLLDDVFSELDEGRQKSLTTEFKQYQTIIASVNAFPVKGEVVNIT